MKSIHPKYHEKAKVICSCGNVMETGSTMPEMRVEICSACHPFYTGKHKLVDVAGRVDKFKARQEKAKKLQAVKVKKTKKAEVKKSLDSARDIKKAAKKSETKTAKKGK